MKVIVGFAAGGPTDLFARLIAQKFLSAMIRERFLAVDLLAREKLTRRLGAELRGSPPFRRQRTEDDPVRDPIEEAVPDDIADKDPAR